MFIDRIFPCLPCSLREVLTRIDETNQNRTFLRTTKFLASLKIVESQADLNELAFKVKVFCQEYMTFNTLENFIRNEEKIYGNCDNYVRYYAYPLSRDETFLCADYLNLAHHNQPLLTHLLEYYRNLL